MQVGKIKVQPCFEKTFRTTPSGDVAFNYGQVAMDVQGGVQINASSELGKSLREFFQVKGKFDAVVALELRRNDALLYQKPLYSISVAEGNGTAVKLLVANGNDVKISPRFVIDGETNTIVARLTVTLVKSRDSQFVNSLKDGVSAAAAVGTGGTSWLVTAFASEALLSQAIKIESSVNKAYSQDIRVDSDGFLGFEGPSAFKSVLYDVSIPQSSGPPAKVKVTVFLSTLLSLVTPNTTTTNNVTIPNTNNGTFPNERWAARVKIKGDGSSLADALDGLGVSKKLTDIKVDPDGDPSELVPKRTQVDDTCDALEQSLSSGVYKLSYYDREMVLFDELKRNNVFKVYDMSDLSCLSDNVAVWTSLGIKPPAHEVKYPSTPEERVARLDELASQWAIPDKPTRQIFLPKSFSETVLLTAEPNFLKDLPSAVLPGPDGLATRAVSPFFLAEKEKTCFGNFLKPPEKVLWATGFARFKDDPKLYLVRITVSDRKKFAQDGPQVTAVTIKPASDAEIAQFSNSTKSCIAPN